MSQYSPEVLRHFEAPQRVGPLQEPCARARRENPVCGDVAEFWVRVEGERLAAVRFRAFGCVAAIAACSCLAELVEGLSREEAGQVSAEDLEKALGGLPTAKRHGAALAVQTLRAVLHTES